MVVHVVLHEVLDPVGHDAAEDRELFGNADEAQNDGEGCDQQQRPGHAAHAFGRMLRAFRARFAQEGQADLAHGVERGQEGRERQCREDPHIAAGPCAGQDLILGPEAGRQQREAAQRQAADDEGPAGPRHAPQQAAHVAHVLGIFGVQVAVRAGDHVGMGVLLAVFGRVLVGVVEAVLDAVDHATGAEEEQRLEEGVGDQMEQRRSVGADTDGRHHVAQLGNGGIGQYALDVPLRQRNRRGEEGRKRTDEGHERQGTR